MRASLTLKSKLLVAIITFLPTIMFAEDSVRIANGEWAPFQSEGLKHYGLSSRIMSESFARSGLDVEYVFLPWTRGLKEVKDGQSDGSGLWAYNEDRASYAYFSEPALEFQWVFFHNKFTNFDWKDFGDLRDYRIGLVHGYDYGEEFNKVLEKGWLHVEYVSKDSLNFKKLLRDRIDLAIFEVNNGYHILQNEFSARDKFLITHHSKPLIKLPLHFIVSKKSENASLLIDKFNEGLVKLKKDGALKKFIIESQRGDYSAN